MDVLERTTNVAPFYSGATGRKYIPSSDDVGQILTAEYVPISDDGVSRCTLVYCRMTPNISCRSVQFIPCFFSQGIPERKSFVNFKSPKAN